MSWKHTGFSVDNSVTVYPSDQQGLERLARYLLRSPVSLQRLHFLPETQQVIYQQIEANKGHDRDATEIIDPMDFVARVLMQVPEPNKHRGTRSTTLVSTLIESSRNRTKIHPLLMLLPMKNLLPFRIQTSVVGGPI